MKRKIITNFLLAAACIFTLAACGQNGNPQNTADDVTEGTAENNTDDEKPTVDDDNQKIDSTFMSELATTNLEEKERSEKICDFSFELLNNTVDKENQDNTLISPVSVSCALSMAALGAEDTTYEQIADLVCEGAAKGDFAEYGQSLLDGMEDGTLKVANSLWANEDLMEEDGVELNRTYQEILTDSFDAESEILPFDDAALTRINQWVSEKTDDQIPSILDDIPDDTFLYLINAISFDGKWETAYEENQVNENGVFTNSQGEEETAKMLYSTENYYLQNDIATGFLKYYKGGRYAFMAILPKEEDQTLSDFISNFDGEMYLDFYRSYEETEVITQTPSFTFDDSMELSGTLQAMGMTQAFDKDLARFPYITTSEDYPLYISQVIHKTHIRLDENGTQASAVTAIGMARCTSIMEEPSPQVVLDRPFVFAIVDTETELPVFLGAVNSVN